MEGSKIELIVAVAIVLIAALVLFKPQASSSTSQNVQNASGKVLPGYTSTIPLPSQQNTTSNNSNSTFAYTPISINVNNAPPNPDPNGPFYHDVYVATSTDGLNFTNGTFLWSHASVPGAVLANNTIFVYYVDGTNTSPSGLIVARSTDLGKTWTRYALIYNTQNDCGADPDPVLLQNDTIRLYVKCGFPPQTEDYIGSATSTDGISFSLSQGMRVAAGNSFYTDPDAVYSNGQWGLYISNGPNDIAYNSTNGINFTEVGTMSTVGAVSGSIALKNGTIRHYFCGKDGIDSAISATPSSTWQFETGTRIPTGSNKIICDPSPIQLTNGTYMMFYKIQP